MTTESNAIPLAEVLAALREDLKTLEKDRDPKRPLIIEEIEVELQVVASKAIEGNGQGKVGIGVLNAALDVKGKWAKVSTQKLRLKLLAGSKNPKTGKIEKARVNDEADFE